jgi:hypothetical protein
MKFNKLKLFEFIISIGKRWNRASFQTLIVFRFRGRDNELDIFKPHNKGNDLPIKKHTTGIWQNGDNIAKLDIKNYFLHLH